MTPEEKALIDGVFDRLMQSGVGTKDAQADALIHERARETPDAYYGLVQAVVVLEAGLKHAQAQINDLQAQVAAGRSGNVSAPSGGGFLPNSGPWGAAAPAQPRYQAAPVYPSAPPSVGPWAQSASPVGGFLRNAATMAAGVAGGTLIAEGLSSMFGGHGYGGGFGGVGGFGGGSPWGGGGGTVENVTVNNYYDGGTDPQQDSGVQDVADDGNAGTDGWDSGYDDSGSVDDGSI